MSKQITCIVLAAGVGKRMWPLTTNKATFPLFGLPLFAHTVGELPKDVSRMIVVTSPQNDTLIRSFRFPIPTSTVIQREATGMGDAVLACERAIDNSAILVINVDDVVDISLPEKVVEAAAKDGVDGVIPGWKAPSFGPYGYLAVAGDRVTGIVEKPAKGKEPSPYVNIVCHYIGRADAFIEELKKTKSSKDDAYEKALSRLMQRYEFTLVPYAGNVATLKYPWHVLDVVDMMLGDLQSYRGKGVKVKDNVIIEGEVYIDDGVTIYENTKIVGPAYIGKGTTIGNGVIIRRSHIGEGCVLGFGTDITRSYIGNNCWTHDNYIGDSVLEENISMGGGARLANLRLDDGEISSVVGGTKLPTGRTKLGAVIGSGVRIGVNASIMPGVKIGAHSFIGSGVVLDRDIPEKTFVTAKPGYIMRKNVKTAPPRKTLV